MPRGRVVPPPPPPRPATQAQKQGTVWAAEQVFGGRPGVVMPPPPKKPVVPQGPNRWSIVAKAKAPGAVKGRVSPQSVQQLTPVPLSTRYRWAKQAPVNVKARAALVATMTPHRRAALAQSLAPQLPAPSHGGFFSDPLGLHAISGLPGVAADAVRGVPNELGLLGRDAAATWHGLNAPLFSRKYTAEDVGAAKAVGKGIARETQGLIAKASQYGTLSATGQPMANAEATKEAAAMPVQPQVFANLAAEGLGGAAMHVEHPLYAVSKDFQYAHAAFNGTTQLGGLLVALPQMSTQERNTALAGVLDQASAAFHKFSNLTVSQAFAKGQQDPMNGIINAVSVFDPAFKGIEALKMGTLPILARNLRAGFSVSDSLDHVQQLRLRGPGGEISVEKPLPRGYIARQVARGGYRVSRAIDRPGVIDRPFVRRFTETGRAARQVTRLQHETMTRDMAKAASIYRDIRKVTRGRFGQHKTDQELRLVLEHQMSQGHSYTEGLQAVAEDMRQMLAGRKFETPGVKDSPGLARARSRVERFAADAERANQRQRGRSIIGISKEQHRLTDVLAKVTTARDGVRAEMRRINAAESLSAEERTAQLATQQEKMRALDSQAKDTRQQLALISVDHAPIESPARTEFANMLAQHPNFDEAQTNDMLAIGDAAARTWAQHTGQDPAAWWDQHEFMRAREGEIPEAAYGQTRPPANVEGLNNAELEKVATALVKQHGHLSGALPPGVKGGKALSARGRELARLVLKGWDGRDWYTDSGRAIRAEVGDDWDAAVKIAQSIAYLSRTDSVVSNTGHALRAFRNYMIDGDVGLVGRYPNDARKALNEIFRTGDWGGYKTNSFFRNILEEVDKAKYDKMFEGQEPSTIDRWMVRALGYGDDNVGQMGRQMVSQGITAEIARQFGLTPKQAQAAAWVAVKAEHEGTDIGSASFHIGSAIDRTTNSMRVNFDVHGFPEFETWKPNVQRAFSREVAYAAEDYARTLRIPAHATQGEAGTGLTVGIGAAQREATAAKYGLGRVTETERPYYDGYVAGIGRAIEAPSVQWTRPMVEENVADRTAFFIPRDTVTPAELDALRTARGDTAAIQISHGDGGIWVTLDKESDLPLPEFRKTVGTMVDEALGQDTEALGFAHEGKRVEGGNYADAVRDSGRSEEIDRASGQLSDRFQSLKREFVDDPAAAAQRARRRELTRARSTGVAPERLLAQARKGDLLGAVHYLDGPAGQRVVYLTEHADASTVLHEMVGHAAGEMKRYYPEEFAPVEEMIGKPFEQWTVADHETFARMTERYFLEGHAPTPELVDAFGRIKSWMRAIYAGIKQRLGGRLNPQMRNLLDTYLGGYDDPGAARIGMFFGEERAFSEAQAARGVAAQARSEMERLQKAQKTRAFNKSVKGMQQRLDTLMKQPVLSEAEQLEADTLSEKVLWAEANDAARAWKREQNLKQKLGDLQTALSKPGNTPEHQAAREALAWFSDDRERILRDVFGDQFDEMFANRNDLLTDWLVGHNLLEPDFTTGSAHYFPATVKNPTLRSKIGNVHAALTSRVIGKMKTDRLTLYKRNNMTLWQRGDWNADPVVLVEAHQRAQGFAYMNEMKNLLYSLGRDLTLGEAQGLSPLDDVMFINVHGSPIGTNLRAAIDEIQTGSKTHDVQNFLDGVEGGDNEAAMSSLDRYQQSILLDPKEVLPEGLSMEDVVKLAHDPQSPIRVLPRSMVEMLTPPIRGSSTAPGRALDFGMTLARWALIYANAPGYMLVNGIGNFGYLLAQQGPWRVPWMVANMYRLTRNRALFDRIGGETGELPLLASIARGRGAGKMTRVYAGEQAALSKISAVDRYPRALAWMYEAAKRGYKSDAQMTALLDSNATAAVKSRMVIGDLARNHMVDFDRLTPFERNTITRALFVYPWVRGATAWPFWFAKQYPVRTAALAAVSQNLEQRREKMLGPTPPWYEGLFPISTGKGGRRANVVNAAPYSPTATALSSVEMLHDVVASALGQKGNNTTAHLVDMLAPQWRTAIEGSTGVNQFGKNVTLQDVLKGAFPSMIPGYRLANAMVNPDTAPKIYTNVSRMQQFERTFLRITPSDISIPRLNAQAPPNVPTVSEQIATETEQGKKYLAKVAPGTHWDQRMQRAAVIRATYSAQRTAMERAASKSRQWDPKKLPSGTYEKTPKLTPLADAHLIYTVVKHFLPGTTPSNLPEPQALLREMGPQYKPGTFLGNQVLIKYRNVIYSAYGTSTQNIITQGKKLEAARHAGLAK